MPLRLKSLELQGYKTFASRTAFVFAGTVTAIVGPNGSGKSNIADSLRWVLGEQSYSLLRGKKTEDMIFAGSELRPRAGMASATITFDNEDGWLPIDFSEVVITRRAYRDGQNEYLINGQRVRLKDVSELLAQSGLAERTYTIIGQGLVDAALALKAEERRRLFEEAAGIGLHRSRREEALHRLETTRRNLDRVQDILAELQPRLRSLEKQARRTQEYEQVKADLRVLLREWYGYHWHLSQRELTEAREAARQLENSLEQARLQEAGLGEKLLALRGQVQGVRANLNAWHRRLAQLHTGLEGIIRDLAVGEERIRSYQAQLQRMQVEQAQFEEEISALQAGLLQAEQETGRLADDLADARVQVDSARKALAERQAARAGVEKDLQAARQQLSSLNARQGQAQARLAERKTQLERAQQALDGALQALRAAERELQAAESGLQASEKVRQTAAAARQAADEALQAHQQQIAAAEAGRKETQDRRAGISAELARLKAQLDVLEQAERALTGYSAGTRLLLQAARQDKVRGARGALSGQLDVPAEVETAIAAALGEFQDAVLLEADPDQALDLLHKETARGVLLPLNGLRPAALQEIPAGTVGVGVVGIAADLVKAPPELRPAVDLLLGQVLVVRDRQAARRALADQPFGVRAVTLRGEVFLASGPVISGGGVLAGQTTLSRSRQRRELGEKQAAAASQLAELDRRLAQLDQELKSLRLAGEQLVRAQRTARQEEEKAVLAASQAQLTLEQARRQARWQQEQQARLQADLGRGKAEAEQLSAGLEKLEKEIGQARERVRQHNTLLGELSLDEFQVQLAHWNTRAAVAERALADGKARCQERRSGLEKAQRSQAALLARQQEAGSAVAAQELECQARRQAEGEINVEINALRVLIEPAESELEAVEKEQASLDAVVANARQVVSIAEHRFSQARILQARRQEALDSLQRRIEDDFGLVAFEYAQEISGPTPLPLEGMVEQLPKVAQLPPELEEAIKRQRAQLRRMGAINPEAQAEYLEVKQRFQFLTDQLADLEKAGQDVRQVIAELDELMQREFRKTFNAVAAEFKQIFTRLFGGGSARLVLTDPDDLNNTGIDIEARLPGRRTQGLSLLSGGERSLTASALVFALLKVSPTPFCVLDEVDAMLDEANVGRFRDLLCELSMKTQFVVVTHNRNTVQAADIIYGVTMGRDSSSQVLSLKLDEVEKVVA